MKRSIRVGVFETNSSSTHSLTICSQEKFDQWRDGKLIFHNWNDEFMTENEAKQEGCEEDCKTYDEYGSDYLEYFQSSFTTESGDKVVAFGEYGHDG